MYHPSDPTAPHAGATSAVPADQAPRAPQHSMRGAVIGAGHVGATLAYALLRGGRVAELRKASSGGAAASDTTAAEPRPVPAMEARR